MSWTLSEILEEVERLETEQTGLREEILKICWYMRGGITLDEAFCMSSKDREIVNSIVKNNLETTKKSGLPFF